MTAVDETQALPLVTVTRGRPTAAELAAVVAVLLAAGPASAPPASPARPAAWANRSRVLSQLPPFGPGAWRASALPC
jgi:hypothetical protein